MVDIYHHFRDDLQIIVIQATDRIADDTVGAVLDGNDTEFRLAVGNLAKNTFDRRHRIVGTHRPELALRRLMGKARLRSEVGYRFGTLKVTCYGKEFQKKRIDRRICQLAVVLTLKTL